MRYRVSGADRTTGEDVTRVISAPSSAEAQRIAQRSMLVAETELDGSSELDELAQVAQTATVVRSMPGGMVRVGHCSILAVSVRSIEDVQITRPLPRRSIAVWLLSLGIALVLAGAASHEDGVIALAALPGAVGFLWLTLPGGKRYGWRVHRFHEGSLVVWFDTAMEANRYRAYLIQALPGVPFLHNEPAFFWWISFSW